MPALADLETANASRLGLLGRDYRGVRFELCCEPGDRVQAGAVLMRDARRPEICFTAPQAVRVSHVERGARRKLVSLQMEADAEGGSLELEPPASQDRDGARDFMLRSGGWVGLRTRPFGNIPDPAAEPAALLVTALDTEPGAPSVATIIDAFADEFSAAVDLLSNISDAPLYVCHASAYQPRLSQTSGAICKSFDGDHRAGLPGRLIHALCPIGFAGGEVWHIGYQQVIALGHLLKHGRPWAQRVISIGGDAVSRPRSLLVPAAASIDDLLDGEVDDGPLRILSGSAIYGRELAPGQAYLGADQRQLTVDRGAADAAEAVEPGAIIPGDWLEALAPPGIYPVPLLRALQLGDAERARELGALELVEEDLAPLSHACVSNSDYGLLLRRVLDELEGLR